MKKIRDLIENQIIINKSKFITKLIRVDSIEEINTQLSLIRKKYYDASHNCYAYVLGENAEIQKCSDDGEPSKTAGFPILDVLQKQKVTNILCVVTRYFGGILLGSGGLIRAYSKSASDALLNAKFYKLEKLIKLDLGLNYPDYNSLTNILSSTTILDTIFNVDVTVTVAVQPELIQSFKADLINHTNGRALITELGFYEIETAL